MSDLPQITPTEVAQKLNDNDFVLLDVRTEEERNFAKVEGSVHIPIMEIPARFNELDKNKEIAVTCLGGGRSTRVTVHLLQQGFKNVFQLEGGIVSYYKETGGRDFDGKCYVFDKRITIDINDVNPSTISICFVCGKQTSRMVNCANPECNNHFCMCEECGWENEGACSDECKSHPRRRNYDGTGYYVKGNPQ